MNNKNNIFNIFINERERLLKKKGGYALLFTIVIVSIISVIVAGLTNLTYKQMILTSLVKDSQEAFYTADTAIECALYGHFMKSDDYGDDDVWQCGVNDNKYKSSASSSLEVSVADDENTKSNSYELNTDKNKIKSSLPCFESEVIREDDMVQIKARGYNMCNKDLFRTVQREIEVYYSLVP